MFRLWEPVVQPLLESLEPRVLVEVGCDLGYNTRNLLEFAHRSGAVLHAIDPEPKFDVDEWARAYPETLIFHRATSLDALPSIERPDVVLIDGDHNWYTVFHELKALEETAGEIPGSYPVVLLDDVGWPYGRRDMYYEPERIPDPFRHPHRKAGLRPGRVDLDRGGGLNAHLFNAVRAGGERNGVVTAVEDFIKEARVKAELVVVPGIHGLGVLFPVELRSTKDRAAHLLEMLANDPPLLGLLESVESLRVEAVIESLDQAAQLAERDQQVADLKVRLGSVTQERDLIHPLVNRLKSDLKSHRKSLRAMERQKLELDGEIVELAKARDEVADDLRQLRRRRSVRLALRVSALAKPLTWFLKSTRNLFARPPQAARAIPDSERAGKVPVEAVGRSRRSPDSGRADIIVCVHNALESVGACLDSIVASTNLLQHRLVVVDDGSDEPVRRALDEFASRYPMTMLRNEEARGYTVAANQGIAVSDSRFVVLLNSDTVVAPGWLEKLIRCATTMPDAAVVGPYSNAASWQSIPTLTGPDGSWHVNALPEGISVPEMGALVARWSPQLYPEVPLINGFCYLITRSALAQVGPLDEESFPRGYGEEDDFSIRCADAGYKLYVADDCYIYHAKSQSFTPEGRLAIVRESKELLNHKHGVETMRAKVDLIRSTEELIRSRTFLSLALEAESQQPKVRDLGEVRPVIGWVLPHLQEVGGVRRAIEMTNRLARWGWRTVLVTPDGEPSAWLPILSEVISIDHARTMSFDFLVGSDPDTVWPFLELSAVRKINYHLAAYMLYRKPDDTLKEFYASSDTGIVHVANSKWTAETVQSHTELPIAAIFPGGVDKRLFHPVRTGRTHDVICSGSKRPHKDTAIIEQACSGLTLLKMEAKRAPQHRLAELINSGRAYVSAARHEGFNLAALEAMACGVPVVMTDDGGSREYAVHGENALVVEPRDVGALSEQLHRVLVDSDLRVQLIENGLRTAWAYDWDVITADFAEFLLSRADDAPLA